MIVKSISGNEPGLDLNQVQQNFSRWRETRTKKGPIPKHLWDQAIVLTKTHSIGQVGKALSLNVTSLRKRASVSAQHQRKKVPSVDGEAPVDIVKLAPIHLHSKAPQATPTAVPPRPSLVAELSSIGGLSVRIFSGIDAETLKLLSQVMREG